MDTTVSVSSLDGHCVLTLAATGLAFRTQHPVLVGKTPKTTRTPTPGTDDGAEKGLYHTYAYVATHQQYSILAACPALWQYPLSVACAGLGTQVPPPPPPPPPVFCFSFPSVIFFYVFYY